MNAIGFYLAASPYAGRLVGASLICVFDSRPGPYSQLFLRVEGERIIRASLQAFGCGHAIVSGSKLYELVTGRLLQQALAVTAVQLAEAIGGLPRSKRHYAPLAIEAR